MFNDAERNELVNRLTMILAKQNINIYSEDEEKFDSVKARKDLAELLVDETREFLKGRYNTTTSDEKLPDGIVQTRDTISKEDFGR